MQGQKPAPQTLNLTVWNAALAIVTLLVQTLLSMIYKGVTMYPKYNPKLGGWQIVWGNGQVAHSTLFKTAEDAEQVINKCTF